MMFGIGNTTPSVGTTLAVPGFSDGLAVWKSPSAGFTALQTIASSPSTAFASANLPVSLGVLAVPVGLVAVAIAMSERGGAQR